MLLQLLLLVKTQYNIYISGLGQGSDFHTSVMAVKYLKCFTLNKLSAIKS